MVIDIRIVLIFVLLCPLVASQGPSVNSSSSTSSSTTSSSTSSSTTSSSTSSSTTSSSSSSTAVLNCVKNCSYPNGECKIDIFDKNQSRCYCVSPFSEIDSCSSYIKGETPYKGWGTAVWIAVGIVICVICLERMYSSCKKVYRRRQGREGFSMVPVTDATETRINPSSNNRGVTAHVDSDDDSSGPETMAEQ